MGIEKVNINFNLKKVIIKIAFLILISLFLFLSIEYYEFSRYTINQDLSQKVLHYLLDLQKNDERTLSFHKYLDESIDAFYIIGPYLTSDVKHKIIGQRWYNYETFSDYLFGEILFSGEDFHDGYQQLVFLKGNEIIGFARIQRTQGDFLPLEENKYTVNTKFKSLEAYDNYYILKKANE